MAQLWAFPPGSEVRRRRPNSGNRTGAGRSAPFACRLSAEMASQPPLTGDRKFRDQVVRIAELTVNTSTIEGYEFSNCRIIGPAILGLIEGVSILHCRWDAPGLEAVLWIVPPERGPVIGVVGVKDCVFSNCAFENIGIAGPPELRADFERAFSGS